jgi:hypothetical protein
LIINYLLNKKNKIYALLEMPIISSNNIVKKFKVNSLKRPFFLFVNYLLNKLFYCCITRMNNNITIQQFNHSTNSHIRFYCNKTFC